MPTEGKGVAMGMMSRRKGAAGEREANRCKRYGVTREGLEEIGEATV